MKKGKEWFIKELIGNEADDYDNYYNGGYEDGLAYALKLAHQLDEPEKIVIPQFVADWWEGDSVTMYGGESINKKYKLRLISEFHDRGLGDHLSKVEDWLDENDSAFLDLVNGKPYEVEKGKLYKVSSNNQSAGFWFLSTTLDGKVNIGTNREFFEHDSKCLHITEKQIKDYDPRYWPFAVEVAE